MCTTILGHFYYKVAIYTESCRELDVRKWCRKTLQKIRYDVQNRLAYILLINLIDIYYSWGDFNVSIKPLLVLHKKVIIIFIASSIYTLTCTNNWTSSIVSLKVDVSVIFLQLQMTNIFYRLFIAFYRKWVRSSNLINLT